MNRNSLIKHIELHIAKEGSANALAKKIGINIGALSTILRGKYGANEQKMLSKIATALNYKERDWNVVRSVTNYRIISKVFKDAQVESMWMAISNKAGSGKTETLEDLYNQDTTGAVIFIQAEEWTGRQFLLKLVEKTCGIQKSGYHSLSDLIQLFTNYILEKASDMPVLIIDEADKLKPSAIRALIPIYNHTEHRLGVIMSGTENFQKEMKAGVRSNKKGFDELDSRLGRTYMSLPGMNESDAKQICELNGIADKGKQDDIWCEVEKAQIEMKQGGKYIKVDFCQDVRRLMRLIKRERVRK
jgi:DNA transposition AAA+ family ATPase